MNVRAIGQNIKRVRKLRRISQETLAEAAVISPTYMGAIERGEKLPSLKTLLAIMSALEVSAEIIFDGVIDSGTKKQPMLEEQLKEISKHDAAMIRKVIEVMLEQAKR